MSFHPVLSSHNSRDDQQQLHACDDLEIIDEQHINLDTDRDSLTHHIKDNTPQLTQHSHFDVTANDEHKESSSSLASPVHSPHLPHLSTAFPFHSPFHAHKHTKSSSSICSLPASPTDVSNEHGARGGGGGTGSRRVSRSADPATLFLLHRIMKGDVFNLYTPSPGSPDSFDATPVFVFYDAHGRLGSLYWTTQRKHGARHHAIHEDDDDTRHSSSALSAAHFVRHLSPSHCLPIHSLTFVGHGKPSVLAPTLTSSPLSSACFLTLDSPAHTLHLSHNEASVVRQWVACLRDIFVQNGHDVREADGGEAAGDSPHKGTGGGGGKGAAGLLGLFAEPLDGSDDDSGSGTGNGGRSSVVDSASGKRSSLSVSEKSVDCELLDKRKQHQQKEEMAMCQCVIS